MLYQAPPSRSGCQHPKGRCGASRLTRPHERAEQHQRGAPWVLEQLTNQALVRPPACSAWCGACGHMRAAGLHPGRSNPMGSGFRVQDLIERMRAARLLSDHSIDPTAHEVPRQASSLRRVRWLRTAYPSQDCLPYQGPPTLPKSTYPYQDFLPTHSKDPLCCALSSVLQRTTHGGCQLRCSRTFSTSPVTHSCVRTTHRGCHHRCSRT